MSQTKPSQSEPQGADLTRLNDRLHEKISALEKTVAERQHTEVQLQASIKELADVKFAINQSSIVAITDAKGRILDVNDRFCEIAGYSRQELIGKTHRVVNSGHHPAKFFQEMWQTITSGKVWKGEIKNLTKTGQFYWVETTIVPILGGSGQIVQFIAIRNEITERKKVESDLRVSEARWQFALEGAGDGVWDWDAQTNKVFFSHQWKAMLGYEDSEISDQLDEWDSRVHPDDKAQCYADLNRMMSGETPFYQNEHRLRCKDGSYLWILDRGKVIERDAEGNALRVIGTHTDITTQKQTEASLRQLNEALETKVQERTREVELRAQELERSNAELQQFAYVASHDLQEPLRTISSFTELLVQEYGDRLDGEAEEYVEFIVDGSLRMQQLIKDLLAYSRVNSRGQAFAPTNCENVIERVLSNLQFAIAENQATVTHAPLPEVFADESQVQQLFQNIISNALKFRGEHPPQVHISAVPIVDHQAEKDDDEPHALPVAGQAAWKFCVSDNGIGIEADYREKIFEIFQRLHSRRIYAGTGIGLAICRKIVQRHGGRIWVEESTQKGAAFYFTLPTQLTVNSDPPN
ncbi:MAG: PAS domain-containing protein [Cyanobacteria bacterium P01_D01_bin.105]